jgi:hypothetical protein
MRKNFLVFAFIVSIYLVSVIFLMLPWFILSQKEINPKWSFTSGGYKLEDMPVVLMVAAALLIPCGVAWLILKRKERKE